MWFDVTFLIPEYGEPTIYIPMCPDDEMPDRERERLDEELYRLIDSGAFAEE